MTPRDRVPGVDALIRKPGATLPPARRPAPFRTDAPAPDSTRISVEVSGRISHGEKITVYFTEDEIAALDLFRAQLRRKGIRVDRGRIVRECIAMADQQALEARLKEERQ